MNARKISEINELFPALYHIGSIREDLPEKLKDWVCILGLYVKYGSDIGFLTYSESLIAGEQNKDYFAASCKVSNSKSGDAHILSIFGDFSKWEVKKYDVKEWEKRFAQLVEPTCEIAFFLQDEEMTSLAKLKEVVNHFKLTGEWLGLYNEKCESCGKNVNWWSYYNVKPCEHCNGKIRND